MANAFLEGMIADGSVINVSASGIITKGDWLAFSGQVAIACTDATPVANIYLYSAAGVALVNNPSYDDQGVAYQASALPVARVALVRYSAANSATAGTINIGGPVYPDLSASGIVGQTGRTGVGPIWATAAAAVMTTAAGGTASVTLAPVGVGQLVRVVGQGDATGFAYDVAINLATNVR